MQSAFYHGKIAHWERRSSMWSGLAGTFSDYVEDLVRNQTAGDLVQNCSVGILAQPLKGSLYARQLRRYFEHFRSEQFVILPSRLIAWNKPVEFYLLSRHVVRDIFGVSQDKYADWMFIENANEHPTLERDLGAVELARLRSVLAYCGSELESIAGVLASSQAVLYDFKGPRREDAVAEW